MEKKHISITYEEMPLRELSDADSRLVNMAREATSRSYAPYSHFCVGAAILLDNGEIITGANQENAAFPSGTCAERTACFYAHAAYPEPVSENRHRRPRHRRQFHPRSDCSLRCMPSDSARIQNTRWSTRGGSPRSRRQSGKTAVGALSAPLRALRNSDSPLRRSTHIRRHYCRSYIFC